MKSDLFCTSESYWASAEASVKLVKLLSCSRLTVKDLNVITWIDWIFFELLSEMNKETKNQKVLL